MSDLLQSAFSGLALGALYAVVGIGFVIIHRVTGIVNLAQGALAVLGAYVMASVSDRVPWGLALLICMVVAGGIAAIIGLIVLSMKTIHVYAPVVLTLGIAIASQGIFVLVWGDLPRSYPPVSTHAVSVAGAFLLPQQALLLVTVIILFVLLHAFFTHAYLGKALTACAMNPRSAQLVGVGLLSMGVVAFIVSGVISGLSGAIFGALMPVTPHSHLGIAVAGFAAAVLGDLHSPAGALVGGLVLGQMTSSVATFGSPEYQQVAALLVLVLVLFVRTVAARRGGALT